MLLVCRQPTTRNCSKALSNPAYNSLVSRGPLCVIHTRRGRFLPFILTGWNFSRNSARLFTRSCRSFLRRGTVKKSRMKSDINHISVSLQKKFNFLALRKCKIFKIEAKEVKQNYVNLQSKRASDELCFFGHKKWVSAGDTRFHLLRRKALAYTSSASSGEATSSTSSYSNHIGSFICVSSSTIW